MGFAASWHGLALMTLCGMRCLQAQAQVTAEAGPRHQPHLIATDALPDAPRSHLAGSQELSRAPDPQQTSTASSSQAPASLHGTVSDEDGAILPGATLTLTPAGGGTPLTMSAGENGRFLFSNLPAGSFTVTATASDMAPETVILQLNAGDSVELAPLVLPPAMTTAEVDVMATQHDVAEAELKVEETQRLLGILPNFYVVYNWHAAPLSPRQKFQLAYRSLIDPTTFIITGIVAGAQQATNSLPGYGPGVAGYASRYAANYGDALSGTMIGGAILPVLFHQDPRYFYRGVGTVRSRALYAIAAAFIARGDNGKWQPAYAAIVGDLSAGAISNLYYPASNRDGAGLTIENGLLALGEDAIGNLVQEFVFKHITPHAPNYPSTTPAPNGQPAQSK